MAFISTYRAFPFCQVAARSDLPASTIASASIGLGEVYPVAATFEKTFEWFWRVKKWSVDVVTDWTLTIPGIPDDLVWTGSTAATVPCTSIDTFTDERNLVCATSLSFQGEDTITGGITSQEGAGPITSYDARIRAYINLFNGNPMWRYKTDEPDVWFPRFLVSVGVWAETDDGFGNMTLSNGIGITSDSPYVSTITEAATIDSLPASLWAWTLSDIPPDPNTVMSFNYPLPGGWTQSITSSIAISPSEWWEQDPGDGDGPVWDSATGERTARAMPSGPSH